MNICCLRLLTPLFALPPIELVSLSEEEGSGSEEVEDVLKRVDVGGMYPDPMVPAVFCTRRCHDLRRTKTAHKRKEILLTCYKKNPLI